MAVCCRSLGSESIVCDCVGNFTGPFCEVPPMDDEERGEFWPGYFVWRIQSEKSPPPLFLIK